MANPSGVAIFAQAIPPEAVALLDPRSQTASDDIRTAIATTVAAIIFYIALTVLMGTVTGLRDLLTGRVLHVRISSFSALLRKLSMIALVAVPAYEVMSLSNGEPASDAYQGFTVLAGLSWVCFRAMDRGSIWLDVDERQVRIKRGFAIFSVKQTTIDLGRGLLDATLRKPVGTQTKGRPVYVSKAVFAEMTEAFGHAELAQGWLREAVGKLDLVPAGRRFIAGVGT